MRKLKIGRETLRLLDNSTLKAAAGGETGTGPTLYVQSVLNKCLKTEQTGCVPSYYCTPMP